MKNSIILLFNLIACSHLLSQQFQFRLPTISSDGPIGTCIIYYDDVTTTGETNDLPLLVYSESKNGTSNVELRDYQIFLEIMVKDFNTKAFLCFDGYKTKKMIFGPFTMNKYNPICKIPKHQFLLDGSEVIISAFLGNVDNLSLPVAVTSYSAASSNSHSGMNCYFYPFNFNCDSEFYFDKAIDKRTNEYTANIYPNPSVDFIKIKLPDNTIDINPLQISIIDISGNEVLKQYVVGRVEYTFSIESLNSGLYYVIIYNQFGQLISSNRLVVSSK